MNNRTLSMKKLIQKIWVILALLIILAAVLSSLFRSLTPWAKQYKGEVAQHLSFLLGQPVSIKTMETGWYWFQPVLKLNEVTIRDKSDESIHLDKLLVGINLFKSLWHWRIQPGVLYIDDMHLVFRQKGRQWHIDGISSSTMAETEMTPERTRELIAWLSQQEKLIIRHVSATFHLSDGGLIPVEGLNMSIANSGGHYKIKGEAALSQTNGTRFKLLGDVYFNPEEANASKGKIYFSAQNWLPAQWQGLFPVLSQQLQGGKGNIDLWIDLDKGQVSALQANVKINELAWRDKQKKQRDVLQLFAANLSWQPDENGWLLKADKVQLQKNGIIWPENQLMLKHNAADSSYVLFVKNLLIAPLLAEKIDWPAGMQKIIAIKPQGQLLDTQLLIKNQQIHYALTRFEALRWNAGDKIPAVSNLTGALSWQATEGRLDLDTENAVIEWKGYPKQQLTLLNGSIDWKELNDGYRVSMERLVLTKPDLTVSAEGVVDKVTPDSLGHIRLSLDFAGKNLHQWIPFIPQMKTKPKLFFWLNHDVRRIGEASGSLRINGLAQEFPFDNHNGVFSLISHLSDTDLKITTQWQTITNLEGYLKVNNRDMDVDVVRGEFNGAPLKQVNLRIDGIGKDRETMLLHGIIQGEAQKMIDFVLDSPLKKQLFALKIATIKGLLLLNLRLEVPLYSGNDTVLARGELSFNDNRIEVKHHAGSIEIEDVNGELSFNEKGVTQSLLTASALGYPLHIKMQSVKTPKPATQLIIDGECTVESLKSKLSSPLFHWLKGVFFIEALITLTDDPNDWDHARITSSLEGLAINLPSPLGKTFKQKKPLEVLLDFNPKKSIRMKANYADELSTDLLFEEKNAALTLSSGQIALGHGHAANQNQPGLALVGSLADFDLDQWKKVLLFLPEDGSSSWVSKSLRVIQVSLGKLRFFQQDFDNMQVTAKPVAGKDWSFVLKQKKIAADLLYHSSVNEISGLVDYLHLDSIGNGAGMSKIGAGLRPAQIPNLNVRIDDLSVGNKKIGSVTLKSQSTPNRLAIQYLKVDAPYYQASLVGDWTQKGAQNQTKVQAKMHWNNLAKSLEQWNITPAVDAGKGDMEFRGGWNGAIYDFSLAKLNGAMYLRLTKGRITHLSPETEEKLGLGKLLSILSLQTIPRRLTLDFSDLSEEGYSFDVFQGDFSINNGRMTTQNSYIDGPVAYASMKGDLDLVRKLYDLNLKISPHITASLPVVATIAGGPIAGLATWVASKIINQGMQKITGYSYKISGPWSQPVVQQLTIQRAPRR